MNDENELLEPLATEAGQEAIVRAIRDISSLEYAVRAELAASLASVKAGEASQSAIEASNAEDKAKDWATKTDTYVEQETITIPPEQEGEEPTTETINLYSARYYAALALDIYNNMSFDSVPTENSTNMVNSGTVYSALDLKADKSTTYTKTEVDTALSAKADLSTTYTKTEVDTALSNVQSTLTFDSAPTQNSTNPVTSGGLYTAFLNVQSSLTFDNAPTLNSDNPVKSGGIYTALAGKQDTLTFDNVPTANSDNPVKSSGIKTALDGKQDNLTFDSTPTANSTNPVTSGGVYTALLNVDIDVDTTITENSDNPVTSAAIYAALLNFTPFGGGSSGDIYNGDVYIFGTYIDTDNLIDNVYNNYSTWRSDNITYTATLNCYVSGCLAYGYSDGTPSANAGYDILINDVFIQKIYANANDASTTFPILVHLLIGDILKILKKGYGQLKGYLNSYGEKHGDIVSEQMYSNVLYENASGWNSGNITLSDSLDNYDFIEILSRATTHTNDKKSINIALSQEFVVGEHFDVNEYDNKYIRFLVYSKTQLNFVAGESQCITKIIGIKMAKGGYSGIVSDARMTVKSGAYTHNSSIQNNQEAQINITFDSPMPDTNYYVSLCRTDTTAEYGTLTRYKATAKTINGFTLILYADGHDVGSGYSVDWIAIRPNSYTREGMVEDVLFSNASGVNSGTINLSGNISDYDLIAFQVWTGQETYACGNPIIQTSTLLEFKDKGGTYRVGADRAGLGVVNINVISDNQFNLIEYTNSAKIYKITGIKFGRYVSGVAVDTTVTQNSNAVVTSGAVYDALQNLPTGSGDVTTDTAQNITGTKTFVGSKKVAFKQSTTNDKLGFTLFGNTGTERGYLEFNPTNTVDGVAGLMTLGNYATSAAALTQVGFRRYSNISGLSGAYNLLMPMVADARTPFSLTTSYLNFYLPLGFTDGTTTVRTAKSGLVDLSPLLASLESRIAALEGN